MDQKQRQSILARAAQPKVVPLDMPEWGADLYVREMSAADRDYWEVQNALMTHQGQAGHNFRARMIVLTVCNADGNRVFTQADADALGNLPREELARAFDRAMALNTVDDEDERAQEKNS